MTVFAALLATLVQSHQTILTGRFIGVPTLVSVAQVAPLSRLADAGAAAMAAP